MRAMTSRPFFSIAIPTKNRPDRTSDAVRSVLEQTFDDVEVVVCDNSDESEAAPTARAVQGFSDPRVRYVRTNGQLSMPDNWDTAISEARGEFVGILTDRSVFRPDALQVISNEIQRTDARCVSWFNDLYGRDESGTNFKRRRCTLKRHEIKREDLLWYFLNGDPKHASKIVPKLMTSVFHRSILDAIRSSPAARCCPPVAPDYTSGFLMLAHNDWVLKVDEALYVSCGTGNGSAFRRGEPLADQFRRDLGMTWADMVDRMPSQACFAHALILNDFLRVRDMVPDRLPALDLNRAQYYVGCMTDYVKTTRHGVLRNEDLGILLAALEHEPVHVRRQVRATRVYLTATTAFHGSAKQSGDSAERQSRKKAKEGQEEAPSFESVFTAMAWDAANPREPAPPGFLDLLPTVEQMKKAPEYLIPPEPEDRSAEGGAGAEDAGTNGGNGKRVGDRLKRLLRS